MSWKLNVIENYLGLTKVREIVGNEMQLCNERL